MYTLATAPFVKEDLLPGVDMTFLPLTKPMIRAGKKVFAAALEGVEEGDIGGINAAIDAFAESLVMQGATDWAGVGDLDGEAIPFSPEALKSALQDPVLGQAMVEYYAAPTINRELEKNVSSLASNGTVAGETAAPVIAPTASQNAVESAPTSASRRKPRSAKPRGKS